MKRFFKFIILCIMLKDCVHTQYNLNDQPYLRTIVWLTTTPNVYGYNNGYLQHQEQQQQQHSNGFQSQQQMTTQYHPYHPHIQRNPNQIENQPQILMVSSATDPYASSTPYIAGQHRMQVQYNSGAQQYSNHGELYQTNQAQYQDPNFQQQYQSNKILRQDGRHYEASQYQYQAGTQQTQKQYMTNDYSQAPQNSGELQGQISLIEPTYNTPNSELQPQETTVPHNAGVLFEIPPIRSPNNSIEELDSTQHQYQGGELQLQQQLQNSLKKSQSSSTRHYYQDGDQQSNSGQYEGSQYQYQDVTQQTQEQHMTNGYYQAPQNSQESQGQISLSETTYNTPNSEIQPQETTVPPNAGVLFEIPPIGSPNNSIVEYSTQHQYQGGEQRLRQQLQNSLENSQPSQTQTEISEIENIQPHFTETIPKLQVITPNAMLVDVNIQTDKSQCAPGVQGLLGIPGSSSKFLRCRDSKIYRKACSINTDAIVMPTKIPETLKSVCANRDPGIYAHPYDCSKFVECSSYGKLFEKDCAPGTAFNVKLSRCDYIHEVQCNEHKTADATHSTGIYCPNGVFGPYPYPFSNEQFINCSNSETFVEPCPPGTTFSLSKSYCEVSDNRHLGNWTTLDNPLNEKTHRIVTCPTSYNGSYLYPFDPMKYIICQNSIMQKMSCASGDVFSISKGTCMASDQTDLSDSVRSVDDMKQTDSEALNSLYQQYNKISCPMEAWGVFPYPFANNKYIKCIDARLLIEQCRSGFLFSLSRKLCDIPHHMRSFDTAVPGEIMASELGDVDIVNSEDTISLECPLGVSDNFVYPFLNTRYTKCLNGVTEIQTCLDGAIYSISRRKCLPRNQVDRNDYVEGIEMSLKRYSNDHTLGVSCGPENNGYYAHPEDWRKYVICQDGIITVKTCEGRKTFDMTQHKCV